MTKDRLIDTFCGWATSEVRILATPSDEHIDMKAVRDSDRLIGEATGCSTVNAGQDVAFSVVGDRRSMESS